MKDSLLKITQPYIKDNTMKITISELYDILKNNDLKVTKNINNFANIGVQPIPCLLLAINKLLENKSDNVRK